MKRVSESSGSNYSVHKEVPKPQPKVTPVGSVYKKTEIPDIASMQRQSMTKENMPVPVGTNYKPVVTTPRKLESRWNAVQENSSSGADAIRAEREAFEREVREREAQKHSVQNREDREERAREEAKRAEEQRARDEQESARREEQQRQAEARRKEEEQYRREDEAHRKYLEEKSRREAEELRLKEGAQVGQQEEVYRRQQEEEEAAYRRQQEEEEAAYRRQQEEEEAYRRQQEKEDEAHRKYQEEAQRRQQEEAQRKQQEEAQRRQQEEAQRRQQEEAQRRQQEEAQREQELRYQQEEAERQRQEQATLQSQLNQTADRAVHASHAAGATSVLPNGNKGVSAVVLFAYDASEANEMSLEEGEVINEIDQVDEGWWFGISENGKKEGLFPANYVEVLEEQPEQAPQEVPAPRAVPPPPPTAPVEEQEEVGKAAIALYDYEAGEDNEISFNEGDTVTQIEFVSDDWWQGLAPNKKDVGLFPANYVELK
ncbi:unnamed protein product [Rhizopus stolonifer]